MILGAGAGGFGAAYILSKNKIPNIVVDRNSSFGGNAVFSGVSCFEPGVSLEGVHKIIADMLTENGGGEVQKTVPQEKLYGIAVDVSKKVPPPYPWGLSVKYDAPYDETLCRCMQFRSGYPECFRFMTDEDELTKVMDNLVDKKYSKTLFESEYVSCKTDGKNISSVVIKHKGEETEIFADYFIDSSGSIVLARDAGCAYNIGDNSGEISGINGVSFVFRVSKRSDVKSIDTENPTEDLLWKETRMKATSAACNMYPNGDININMLPTLTGEEWFVLGEKAIEIGKSRVLSYWKYLKDNFGLDEYKIIKIFAAGIREDYRLSGRKVLELEDIKKPFDENEHYLAIADHSLDIHGVKNLNSSELEHPYGIPLDCARPKEFDNLFVACRGASFTHIAASSARLTRTMMSMGEGVAKYISELIN